MFDAILLHKDDSGIRVQRDRVDESSLPAMAGGVLVRPSYSTVNYKDALAITNKGPVVRLWPMIPGIDGAGVVLESDHPDWQPGDRFVHNGWGAGETHWGCMAQMARLSGDWLVPLPSALTPHDAMAIGTAGYTAMLCVMALERHGVVPGDGEILVTGATGGVGSIAVALLARLGHTVVAATGKPGEADYLASLGAGKVINRGELTASSKPLQKERWAAAIDVLGGATLANICAQVRYGGVVAACGLAHGPDLPATVMPFILRAVTLIGVDSVMAPIALRREAWKRLASDLDPALLKAMTTDTDLDGVPDACRQLMEGRARGRIVVRIP